MKKLLLIGVIAILYMSCAEKLTESKVKQLVNTCLEKKPDFKYSDVISTGLIEFWEKEDEFNLVPQLTKFQIYQKLEKKGLLTMTKKSKEGDLDFYIVELTKNAKQYITYSEENDDGSKDYRFRLCTYKLDNIKEIKESTEENKVRVTVTFRRFDKTPFFDVFNTDPTEIKVEEIVLHKTENKGWIYCNE